MADRWRPWRQLGREHPDVDVFLVDDLPHGVRGLHLHEDGFTVILIDRGLEPVERLAVLAHELVHHERGGSGHQQGLPPSLRALVGREEARVAAIVADRLIPADDLEELVDVLVDLGEPVTADLVADRLQAPLSVAQVALERLRERRAA